MTRDLCALIAAALIVLGTSAPVFAHPSTDARDALSVVEGQGSTTSSLSGTVTDAGGGVIPGATVVVKNNGTGTTFTAVTNSSGAFSVPALDAGVYTVTVTLQGFKSAVLNDVRLAVGTPVNVTAKLEVGALSETVEVKGSGGLVNTQTPAIASTLNVDQINRMPMPTRNAINAVTFLPGVNTAGNNRDSNFNGLPDSFVAISLDGVNNNENFNKSTEGLFAMVTPRQDAIEAVTVTTAAGGADIGGHGAVQIAFVTRSGSNRFTGSGYQYYRHPRFNTNYWFNENAGLGKNDVRLNQYGGRQGGPIVIPGVYDGRGKAFFFANYEELRLPNDFTRTRVVMTPDAQAGWYSYGTRRVNVLDLAAQSGQLTSLDPTVMKVLNDIRAATASQGVLNQRTDPNTLDYLWQSPGNQTEKQWVSRFDYNLSSKHRLTGTYNWQVVIRDPDHLNGADARFPNLPNARKYVSYRPLSSGTLRSTLTSNLVNEVKGGIKWGPSYFGENPAGIRETFGGSGGFALTLGAQNQSIGSTLTNWHTENGPSWRSAWSWNIDDTVNWQKGRHSLSFGTSLYFGNVWVRNQQMAPTISFGVNSNDPANAMFNTTNFPGASGTQLNQARQLYALLTGRVTSLAANIVLDETTNQYEYLGTRRQAGRMNEYSLFVQDSWRMTPTLTVNAGLRWDVQMPFTTVNDVLATSELADACGISGFAADGRTCRFFEPGASGGKHPTFVQYNRGTRGYTTDWNNVAPNIGFAWRPDVQNGWLRAVLGDPDQATIRGGYSVAYDRQGMAVFTGQYGANPGSQVSVTRNAGNGLLVPAGQTWPVLLRDTARLGPPSFSQFPAVQCDSSGACSPAYPIAARPNRADSINIFHPDLKIAFARSYTVSFQRALSRDMAVDIRYVGTRGVNQWTEENWNETNIIESRFLDEFRLAMANLQANNAAGGSRAGSFAYFGPGTATSALPIYLGYFTGRNDKDNPGAYTGTLWTNTDFVNWLARTSPSPYDSASELEDDATRRTNAINAGLPANLLVLNPAVNNVGVFMSDAYSSYDALQIEIRRRLSRGFQINGSYQYALEYGSVNLGKHFGRVLDPTANVRHAFKLQWDWSVPVGRGRRFGTDMNPLLDAVLGGWEFNGAGRIQARAVDFGSGDFGNVRLVGMTVDELTREYHVRINVDPNNPSRRIVTMLPPDIIENTIRAFNVSGTSETGYSALGVPTGRYIAPANSQDCFEVRNGECAPLSTLIRAPWFTRVDMSLRKRFRTPGRVSFELGFDVLNVFDNINFTPEDEPGPGANIFQVGAAYRDPSNTFDPGGRLGQIVWRINW